MKQYDAQPTNRVSLQRVQPGLEALASAVAEIGSTDVDCETRSNQLLLQAEELALTAVVVGYRMRTTKRS